MSIISLFSAIEKGFTPLPLPLPLRAHHTIYTCLENREARMYPTICRDFRKYKALDSDVDKKIVKIIREKYQILGRVLSDAEIKELLFSSRGVVICCGGDHTFVSHQVLNGTFVKELAVFGFNRLFIEGGETILKKWKKEKTNFFADLAPEIADAVETWDVNIENYPETVQKCQESRLLVSKKVFCMQKLFLSYSDQKNWSLQHFDQFLKDTCPSEAIPLFKEKVFPQVWGTFFPKISWTQVPAIASRAGSREFLAEIYKIAAIDFIRRCAQEDLLIDIKDKFAQDRNERLFNLTLHILQENQKGVFVAGSSHIDILRRVYEQHKPKSAHLFLIPQKTLSRESVSKKTLHAPLSLEGQIKRLLAFKVESLDMNLNHFGTWNERANELLALQEKTSLEKLARFGIYPTQ